MKHKTLAIILAVLLGGMAIYYNLSVSNSSNAESGTAGTGGAKIENTK